MATIKTKASQGEVLVITKTASGDRRVSCSCCEDCCFYSVIALQESLFTFDDFPDEVEIYNNVGGIIRGPVVLSKSIDATSTFGTIIYGSFNGNAGPFVRALFDEYDVEVDQVRPGLGPCLFDDRALDPVVIGEGGIENVWVYDRFADTYTINGTAVTRSALCLWSGLDGNGNPVSLTYEGGSSHKWRVTTSGQAGNKIGTQNTPIGSYENGAIVA